MPGPSEPGGPTPEGPEPRTGAEPRAGAEPRTGPAPGSPEEALRRLEQRLDQASEAAERLMAQVAAQATRAGAAATAGEGAEAGNPAADEPTPDGSSQAPPAGWQTPEDEPPRVAPELDPLLALLHTMRDLIPPELQQRLISALREVLLALRALIDWYLERMDRRPEQGVEVQDIPIL